MLVLERVPRFGGGAGGAAPHALHPDDFADAGHSARGDAEPPPWSPPPHGPRGAPVRLQRRCSTRMLLRSRTHLTRSVRSSMRFRFSGAGAAAAA
jgi:hypothetical protein